MVRLHVLEHASACTDTTTHRAQPCGGAIHRQASAQHAPVCDRTARSRAICYYAVFCGKRGGFGINSGAVKKFSARFLAPVFIDRYAAACEREAIEHRNTRGCSKATNGLGAILAGMLRVGVFRTDDERIFRTFLRIQPHICRRTRNGNAVGYAAPHHAALVVTSRLHPDYDVFLYFLRELNLHGGIDRSLKRVVRLAFRTVHLGAVCNIGIGPKFIFGINGRHFEDSPVRRRKHAQLVRFLYRCVIDGRILSAKHAVRVVCGKTVEVALSADSLQFGGHYVFKIIDTRLRIVQGVRIRIHRRRIGHIAVHHYFGIVAAGLGIYELHHSANRSDRGTVRAHRHRTRRGRNNRIPFKIGVAVLFGNERQMPGVARSGEIAGCQRTPISRRRGNELLAVHLYRHAIVCSMLTLGIVGPEFAIFGKHAVCHGRILRQGFVPIEQCDGVEHGCDRVAGIPSKHCTLCVRKSAIHGLRSVKVNRTVRSGVAVHNAPVDICGSNGIGIRCCSVSCKPAPYCIAVVHSASTGRNAVGNYAVNKIRGLGRI